MGWGGPRLCGEHTDIAARSIVTNRVVTALGMSTVSQLALSAPDIHFPESTMQSQDLPTDYQPIACSRHDQLESIATLRSRVTISYLDDTGVVLEVTDQIADLYARRGAEFLRTVAGLEIRLDRLVSVAGISFR